MAPVAAAELARAPGPADQRGPVTVEGVEIDPECEPPPKGEEVESFFATLLTGGGAERVLPDDPTFPFDYCPKGAVFATRGGRTTGGTSTLGDWVWAGPGSCALPGSILWAMHEIEAELGTILVLEETQVIFPNGCEPARPCAAPLEFDGRFTVLGGTGRYRGARGIWRGVGRQRGDGHSAVALCGWLDYPSAR